MRLLTRLLEPKTIVHAHCDLPCGVYDPAQARIEAESVKAIAEKYAQNTDPEFRARAIFIKEQRSELVKHHLWVLWTDYFKPPHFEKYPQLHQLFNEATKLAGAAGTKGSWTWPRRTNCWPRSTRSTRSSGRPSRPRRHRGVAARLAIPPCRPAALRRETRVSGCSDAMRPGFHGVQGGARRLRPGRGRRRVSGGTRRVTQQAARRVSRHGPRAVGLLA